MQEKHRSYDDAKLAKSDVRNDPYRSDLCLYRQRECELRNIIITFERYQSVCYNEQLFHVSC